MSGSQITKTADSSVFGYCTSDNSIESLDKSIESFARLEQGKVPIISCEGWVNLFEKINQSELFPRLDVDADIVLYIRPPLEWLNSAFWQWGAWTNATLDRWLNSNIEKANWSRYIDKWEKVCGVKSVNVRLATTDVVADFMSFLEVDKFKISHSNNFSSSPDLLRFLLRNRKYREGPHHPHYEFVVNKFLNLQRSQAPWVLPEEFQKRALSHLRGDQLTLEKKITREMWQKIENDQRWWDQSVYAEKQILKPNDESNLESADRLISSLIEKINLSKLDIN
ncbi:hypothetical protein [Flexibacterium corallicola]|uniref:hypothetical protein n=1 Tax=Flexibacterium corallicola TaxID=3037259 RepID=UPI00286F8844|nr:hypothetical protein [Pseudovibrio sp. M1P-2-3]